MGKGNRSRTNRAAATVAAAAPKASNSSAKSGLTTKLVAAGVAILLVFFIVVALLTNTGILNSLTTAAKSDHYRVNGNLMNYFYQTEYQSYMQYASYMGIDTSKLLSEQTVTAGDATTWSENIMNSVKNEVQQLLVLCEAAKEAGHKLSDTEKASIKTQIEDLKSTASSYGYTLKAFLQLVYGTGVTEKVVRDALNIQALASSYYSVISEDVSSKLTDADINAYYDAHKNDFLTSDTLEYTYTAALDTGDNAEATEEQKQAYEADKAAQKALADKLAAAKSADEFKSLFTDNAISELNADSFAAAFLSAISELEASDKAAINTMKEEDVTKAKEEIRAHIADEDNVAVSDPALPEGVTLDTATDEQIYAAAVEYAKNSVLNSMQREYDNLEHANKAYIAADSESATDMDKWLADAARKAGDCSSFATENETKSTYTAVIVTRAASRDESKTRNVAHILVTEETYGTDEAAKAKANEILVEYKAGTLTLDAFKALGEKYTEDSGVYYENVAEGDMVAEFNDWLFDEARKDGDTDVVKTDYGYHVMYFAGEGAENWFASAKDAATTEKLNEWSDLNAEKYNVNFSDSALKKLASKY